MTEEIFRPITVTLLRREMILAELAKNTDRLNASGLWVTRDGEVKPIRDLPRRHLSNILANLCVKGRAAEMNGSTKTWQQFVASRSGYCHLLEAARAAGINVDDMPAPQESTP